MKLSFQQIKNIATGWVDAEELGGSVCLYRLTKEQRDLYKSISDDFYDKARASSGIKLRFKTDSESLFIKISPSRGSSRMYFSADVLSDGKVIGYLDNFSDVKLPECYAPVQLPLDPVGKLFSLGKGTKEICVHLPWSRQTTIDEISLDDGATLEPVKPSKKLLVFGDSITQGYDALRSSNRYASRTAEALDAEEINKAIGGEVFRPAFSALKDDFDPHYITVAYGTNDWNVVSYPDFERNCKGFFEALVKNYPVSKIFAITPIWREEITQSNDRWPFEKVAECIENFAEKYDNVTVIDGFDLVPHQPEYFGDLRLHPNDKGFDFYYNNLIAEIKKYI